MQIWIVLAEKSNTSSDSGIAGDDDDFGAPILESIDVSPNDCLEFGVIFSPSGQCAESAMYL